jgi:hypothetical protein
LKLCNYLCSACAIHTIYMGVICKQIRSNKSTLKIVNGSAATVLR